jgi:hypothetical protein
LDPTFTPPHDDGFQEFIILPPGIALLDGADRVVGLLAVAQDEAPEAELDAVPALVPIHDVVATDDGGQLPDAELRETVEELLQVGGGALGVGITAIGKEVDEDVGHLELTGDLEKSEQMVDVRVDAAVRDEAQQMQATVPVAGASAGADDGVDLVHLAKPEGLIDADAILPDDATGADVEMADLAVTHETLGQADGERGCIQLSISLGDGVGTGEGRHDGGIGGGDGITLRWRTGAGDAPAIDHDWSNN